MAAEQGARGRVYCPGWTRPVLEALRRHLACLRPVRYMPGMLNTWLSGEGRAGRLVLSLGDAVVLEYSGDEELGDDTYLALLGPRYLQYRLHHYTRGRIERSCGPDIVDEKGQTLLLALQRAVARPRGGGLELCGTNNTIIPLSDESVLSIALAHASGEPVESGGEEEAPWYFDRSIRPRLGRARLRIYAAGWGPEGLEAGWLEIEALHPDPSVLGEPRPHLIFIEWDRQARTTKVAASPLYSLTDHYSTALELASILLLAKARETPGDDPERLAKKVYKKLSRHYEKLGLQRPEGGLQALLQEYPLAGRGNGPLPVCRECEVQARYPGVLMLESSLRTGTLLLL